MRERNAATALAVLWAIVVAAPALAGEVPFTAKPAAVKDGDRVKIVFAVSRETDVAVYVENGKGEIVRHLAAGRLGKNAPEPLKSDSLEQSVAWDGLDDDGRKAEGAPFKVRVGVGLRASYAGVAFADADKTGPNRVEGVMGLAAGPDGRLYVLDRCGAWLYWHGSKILVFGRDGSYEKTIKPFSPTLPIERVKATGAFVNSFGAVNPVIQRPLALTFYSHEDIPQQPAVTPDGRIVLAVRAVEEYHGHDVGHLGMIDAEGGVPAAAFAGPSLKAGWTALPCLASASDGKAVYAVGMGKHNVWADSKPWHAVYRATLPERGPAEIFFGEPEKPGSDDGHLSDPRSVAVDGKGHLLVADFGNNRVVILKEADRSFAGSFPVAAPLWVGANPKTGAIYVASQESVARFSGWKEPKEQARLKLPARGDKDERFRWHFALDTSAETPVLWIGRSRGTLPPLLRCEDQGDRFTDPMPARCAATQFLWRPAADPLRREVACRIGGTWDSKLHILDEATGKVRIVGRDVAGSEGRTHRLGPDGSIYGVDHALGVIRYDRNGKPMPFAATAADPELRGRLPAGNTGTTAWERDFSVDRRNDIYVRKRGPQYHGLMTVEVYGQEGQHKRTALWTVSDGMYGPRVDPKCNLYIMEAIHPIGQPYPEEFRGHFQTKAAPDWCAWIYGSVVKFGPEGGAVWFAGGQASPLDYDGWRVSDAGYVEGTSATNVMDLRTRGGCLTGTIAGKPPTIRVPVPSLDASAFTKVSFRLKNLSSATKATFYYNRVGEGYATRGRQKSIDVMPMSDFTDYTIDLSGEAEWKGHVRWLTLSPAADADKGTFALDWFRIGEGENALEWRFDTEDAPDKKLPPAMKTEKVGSYHRPNDNVLQGALWWRFGFSPLGDMGRGGSSPHCHCTGSDFDVDDFGRVFAPDTGRFRVGVLDTRGNEILSFGAYGNQDFCGPDSYVVDPATQRLRPRMPDDPADLVSPFAKPEIAFGWIVGLAVTDRYAYVDDVLNKRILRVKLDYAVEETCEIQ